MLFKSVMHRWSYNRARCKCRSYRCSYSFMSLVEGSLFFVLKLLSLLCIVQRVWHFKVTLTSTLRRLRSTMTVGCYICQTLDSSLYATVHDKNC